MPLNHVRRQCSQVVLRGITTFRRRYKMTSEMLIFSVLEGVCATRHEAKEPGETSGIEGTVGGSTVSG